MSGIVQITEGDATAGIDLDDGGTQIEAVDLRKTLASGRGTILDLSSNCPDALRTPDLLIGDITRELLKTYFESVLVLGTSVFRIPDAEVIAEGVVLIDGRFNWCDQLNIDCGYSGRHHGDLADRMKTSRRREVEREVVLLAGNGYRMYGHWIVDYLPKLYLLHLAGYGLGRLQYLLPRDTPAFAREWLGLLGIEDRQLLFYDPAEDILACKSLIVPTGLRFLNRVSPLLREARAFMLGKAMPARPGRWFRRRSEIPRRRILVARSQNPGTANRRRLLQREEFETKAVARGFEIHRPETLSVPDQIALFRSARAIYGEYGSGLHASLFSEAGTVVVAARSNDPGLGFVQSAIDQATAHTGGYIIGGSPNRDGEFSIHGEDIDMGFGWLDWRNHG